QAVSGHSGTRVMAVETLRRALLLQALPELSPGQLRQLLGRYGGVDGLWLSDPADWRLRRAAPTLAAGFGKLRDSGRIPDARFDVERQLDAALSCEARLLCSSDSDYPQQLRAIPDAPPVLYCRGDTALLRRPQL